jgi:hypothetical protein
LPLRFKIPESREARKTIRDPNFPTTGPSTILLSRGPGTHRNESSDESNQLPLNAQCVRGLSTVNVRTFVVQFLFFFAVLQSFDL